MNLPIVRALRAKVLLLIVFGVAIPLAIVGIWMSGATERSGRDLLRVRLEGALGQVVAEISNRWVVLRSDLLDLAEAPAVQAALATGQTGTVALKTTWRRVAATPAEDILASGRPANLVLYGIDTTARWSITSTDDSTMRLEPSPVGGDRPTGVTVALPVVARVSGDVVGTIETQLAASFLVPVGAGGTGGIGAVLGIRDRTSGAWLSPLPFDPTLLTEDEFEWAGDHWLVARRVLEEPRLMLAAAAPLSAYTAPFQRTARRGAIALLIVSIAALAMAALLTRRFTMSLERLAVAADAVSRGDLDHQANVAGDDEVGRVGRAFNSMVASLRATLAELSRRERLAAVGEFAASLAHEVRNPLTALRMELQRAEEQLPTESPSRAPLERALRVVTRLNQTVAGALRVARSGTAGTDLVNLRVPLQRALEITVPAITQVGAVLDAPGPEGDPMVVRCDAAAMEQLFLNLLLNAAQSLSEDAVGRVTVSIEATAGVVDVAIRDTGQGISPELLPRVFDPFVSSRPEGTGLGLAIARQIAMAHGGELHLTSEVGIGTIARLRLPLVSTSVNDDGGVGRP